MQPTPWLTGTGLELLATLDEPIRRVFGDGFAILGDGATAELGSRLDRVRHSFRQT